MKIVIISQYYYPEIGAASNRWTDYSELLAEMGHDVTVICERPNYPYGKIYDGYKNINIKKSSKYNLTVIRTWVSINNRNNNFKRFIFFITFMLSSFFTAIKLTKPDLYIASSPPLFVGISGSLISKLYNIPLIIDIRDLWPESAIELGKLNSTLGKKIGFYMQKIVYNQSCAFLSPIPGFKHHLSQNTYSKNKPFISLLNGIGVDIIDQCETERAYCFDTINIIYAGNIGLAQNLELIIKAAKILNDKFQFKIIGDGVNKSQLVSMAQHHRLTNVTFIPALPRNELLKEYSRSHIGLVSLYDRPLFENAIPSKTFEYMAFGLAVFCLVKGEIEAIINESCAGKCIEPENEKMLINAFQNISENEIKDMGNAGKSYVRNRLRKHDLIKSALGKITSVINIE